MVTTEVELTEEQTAALTKLAASSGRSVGELVRRGVDYVIMTESRTISDEQWERAKRFSGSFSSGGPGDVSDRHDDYLADIFST